MTVLLAIPASKYAVASEWVRKGVGKRVQVSSWLSLKPTQRLRRQVE